MDNYSVNILALQETIETMIRTLGLLQENTAEFDGQISEFEEFWKGEAATAHQKACLERSAGFTEAANALHGLIKIAHTAHTNYDSLYTHNNTMWE